MSFHANRIILSSVTRVAPWLTRDVLELISSRDGLPTTIVDAALSELRSKGFVQMIAFNSALAQSKCIASSALSTADEDSKLTSKQFPESALVARPTELIGASQIWASVNGMNTMHVGSIEAAEAFVRLSAAFSKAWRGLTDISAWSYRTTTKIRPTILYARCGTRLIAVPIRRDATRIASLARQYTKKGFHFEIW